MTAIAACPTCGTEPLQNARFCHGCGSPVNDAERAGLTTTAMWALVHGLAFLHLDGKFDSSSADAVAHRVRTAVTAIART